MNARASKNYLVSFHPLCSTPAGRRAVHQEKLPAFIDGSCRREPDLELACPSITALCRAGKFAPRLRVGDRVAYVSVKGRYPDGVGRALVAVLEVQHVFSSHRQAADWYKRNQPRLPSNCMVSGNRPEPVRRTLGLPRSSSGVWQVWSSAAEGPVTLSSWDRAYARRAAEHPAFIVTKPIKPVAIHVPKILSDRQLCVALGMTEVPGTQSYKLLSDSAFDALVQLL